MDKNEVRWESQEVLHDNSQHHPIEDQLLTSSWIGDSESEYCTDKNNDYSRNPADEEVPYISKIAEHQVVEVL